jgi:porphobilinogen synthase
MVRTRRLRSSPILRELVAETRLSKDMFIYPYFVTKGTGKSEAIEAMPGIHRFSADMLVADVEKGLKCGVNKILLFGVGEEKYEDAHSAHAENSVIADAIRSLKKNFGDDLYIITDVCLCAYTTHGHCGLAKASSMQTGKDEIFQIDNDLTLPVLAKMALAHVQAGADIVSPSDMMDGRVAAIRKMLDENKFMNVPIMSYSSKFASAYYGPFREAADSAPGKGDRKSYQMDSRNSREALHEAKIDESEGADIIMVKPALAYLDVIRTVRENTLLPVACYNVSAEYSMVKAAAKAGYIDEQKITMENMFAFARAGAGIIISYHTREIFEKNWL